MKENEKQLQELHEIRNLMERSSRFISLSGLSGVFAGLFAVIGALAAYYKMIGSLNPMSYLNRWPVVVTNEFVLFVILDAIIVFILSISFSIYFTNRKALRQGLSMWDGKVFRMLANLFIPIVAGGVFCLILMYHSVSGYQFSYKLFGLVVPCSLIFYGLGLINASKYTLDEVRWLGLSEVILGLAGCLFIGYGFLFWMVGFGILHILYGSIMWWKYERGSHT